MPTKYYGEGKCSGCGLVKKIFIKKTVLCQPCYVHNKGFPSRIYMRKYRFGGIKDIILKRDGYKCTLCGMTGEEHKKRWNKELTLHHVDGQGRYSSIKNNNPDNLTSLCLPCHGGVDGKRGRKIPHRGKERAIDNV